MPIIDVRPEVDFFCSRIPGAVGVPFMRSITGMQLVVVLLHALIPSVLVSTAFQCRRTTCCCTPAGNSLRQNMRRAGFAFFGIFNGTEFNPSFYDDIEKAVDNKKGAVLVCSIGGILEPLGRGGRQSRYAHRV